MPEGPDLADTMAGRLDVQAAGPVADLLEPIRNLVMNSSSLEEIRDRMIDLFPDMDAADLGTLMQQAMTAAQLAGMAEVVDGK